MDEIKKKENIPSAGPEAKEAYYIIYPDANFSGNSAGILFKNGRSLKPVTDVKKIALFKKLGYKTELVRL